MHKVVRVLQVLEATLGGTRRYLEDIARATSSGRYHNGLAYSLVRADDGFRELLERLKYAGWETFEIDMRRQVGLRDFASGASLRAVYRRFMPDLVHAHSSKAGGLARLAAIGLRPRPAIVYSPQAIAVDLSRAYALAEQTLAPFLDALLAEGPSERAELVRLGLLPTSRIPIVVPTIDESHYRPRDQAEARRSLGYPPGPLVAAVGRLVPQKDPLGFVRLFEHLLKGVPEARAVWVGDGELRDQFKAALVAAGIADRVTITGWVKDVRPYLAAADLFVSVSAYESFGYVTAEALASGRPVVATRITGTVDIVVTDTEKQLFAPGDYVRGAELARAMLLDGEMARKLADRGRQSVCESFSPARTRELLDIAYDLAIQHRFARLSPLQTPSIEKVR